MDDKLVSICCVCEKIKTKDDNWIKMKPGYTISKDQLTHGYCPECFEKELQKRHEYTKTEKK